MLIFYPSPKENSKDSTEERDKDRVEIWGQTVVFAVLINQCCEPVKLLQSAPAEQEMNFVSI